MRITSPQAGEKIVLRDHGAGLVVGANEDFRREDLLEEVQAEVKEETVVSLAAVSFQRPELDLGKLGTIHISRNELVRRAEVSRVRRFLWRLGAGSLEDFAKACHCRKRDHGGV